LAELGVLFVSIINKHIWDLYFHIIITNFWKDKDGPVLCKFNKSLKSGKN
jgi:hypothetical protein